MSKFKHRALIGDGKMCIRDRAKYELRYGDGTVSFEYDEKNVIGVIETNVMEETELSSEEVIRNAMENPVGTPKLEEMVTPSSKVVLAIGDKTRLWKKQSIMIKVVMEKLGEIGVPDENVTICLLYTSEWS